MQYFLSDAHYNLWECKKVCSNDFLLELDFKIGLSVSRVSTDLKAAAEVELILNRPASENLRWLKRSSWAN